VSSRATARCADYVVTPQGSSGVSRRCNRYKIVYTCAGRPPRLIYASVMPRRCLGGGTTRCERRQVGRELGGFSFSSCAAHLIRPAVTASPASPQRYADIAPTFPQHASLDTHQRTHPPCPRHFLLPVYDICPPPPTTLFPGHLSQVLIIIISIYRYYYRSNFLSSLGIICYRG